MSRLFVWRFVVLLFCSIVCSAQAHQSGNSYLQIESSQAALAMQLDFAIKDLNGLLQIPAAEQKEIKRDELLRLQPALTEVVEKSLALEADGKPLSLTFKNQTVAIHNDGIYVRQNYVASPLPSQTNYLLVRYDFFNEQEKMARALFKLVINGNETSSVFDARHAVQRFALRDVALIDTLFVFAREGALHIWSGPDHLLFLLCLLLPGLLLVSPAPAGRVAGLKPMSTYVLKVVTAFTVAHSITLVAAAMDWIALPDRLIEAAIALSIVIAAVLNLTRDIKNHNWKLAFGFGLIHGMGFANGLRELGLSQSHFIETLLAFNLGVESGQLAVVTVALLLVLPFMRHDGFAKRMLQWGSLLILGVAGFWLVERLLG